MSDKFNLTGKRAVVTGGGSGIGEAISKALAGNGADVCVFDIDEDNARRVALEIEKEKGHASFIHCDVSSLTSVKEAFEVLGGELDILVNNAGVAHIGRADNTSPEDFNRIVGVNITGVYNCLHAGIPRMMQTGGVIINMSSVAAQVGVSDRFAYSMSKGAIHGITLSVSKDYLAHGIRCNSIAPARVHTPFVDGFLERNYPGNEQEMFDSLSRTQPIGRMGKPDEIGNLVLYLCSDEASFITGSCFPIDGGFITLNT